MSKNSVIERLREQGVVAAHLNDQNVDMVQGIPRQVTLTLPIFKEKNKFSKGDKVAIVDLDRQWAYICQITRVETVNLSRKPLLHLKGLRKIQLG